MTDRCGNQLASTRDLVLTIGADGHTCLTAIDLSNASFPHTGVGTFDNDPAVGGSCDTYPPPNNAAWFTYTPATSGLFEISALNQSPTDAWSRLAVFETANCAPFGPEVACEATDTPEATAVVALAAGNRYLIMFYTDTEPYTMEDPEITITPATTGGGTMCSLAVDVSAATLPLQLTGSFEEDTNPGGSCDATAFNQAWFSYTPPATAWYSVYAINSAVGSVASRLAVFETDSCNPYGREIACEWGTGATARAFAYLTGGVEHLLLFHTDTDTDAMLDPILDIDPVSFGPGEVCSEAIDLSGTVFPFTVSGTFEQEVEPGGSCASVNYNFVWFAYTPATTDWYDVSIQSTHTAADVQVAVFEGGSCSPRGREVGCAVSSTSLAFTTVQMTQGREYLIAASTDNSVGGMNDPTIEIVATPPPPAGMSCANPADDTAPNYAVDATGHHCWSWPADTADTNNDHSFICDGAVGGDVVATYTTGSTQTSLRYQASMLNHSSSGYLGLEVSGAPCVGGASIYCETGGTVDSGELAVSPGTTYYLWLTDAYSGHARPEFELCVW